MSRGRLVFPGPRGIVLERADERLIVFPARAAAGSRGRRGRPRLLPRLPGRALAVGFEGRWTVIETWRDGESLRLRLPPASDDYAVQSLGEASEPPRRGLLALTAAGIEWPRPPAAGPPGRLQLKLGGAEPLLAIEESDGAWTVCSRAGAVRLSLPSMKRVVAPARIGSEIGLAATAGRELAFSGSRGGERRSLLGAPVSVTAACLSAPWLALIEGEKVVLRQLGPRWGRRLGEWSVAGS